MAFSKDDSPGYLVNDLARRFAHALQARIKPMGLSTGVFPVMVQLWDEDGLTQGELVRRVGVEQATMANTLSRMQRDGLVARVPDERDGRVHRSWLTDRGRALRAPALAAAEEVNALALSGLEREERARFVALLSKAVLTFGASARAEAEAAPEAAPER